MTRYLAITTCNAEQWRQYGQKMAGTFVRHWPAEVPLRLYAEGDNPDSELAIDAVCLEETAPWLEPWKAARTKAQRGWIKGHYNYRFDAVKFAHKVAAIGAAAETDCDCLIWIDADIITFDHVSLEWLEQERVFPRAADLGLLDRATKYPECGYMMFRLPAARELIRQIVEEYQNGGIFTLAEWHDSFVIGHCVKAAVKRGEVILHSFSDPALPKRHPFVNSVLAEKMDHWKGSARKERGKSFPSDLVAPRPEPYWR